LKKFYFILLLFFIGKADPSFAQKNFLKGLTSGFSFFTSANFITYSTIQVNPYSSDLAEKNSIVELKGGYGYGFTLKKRVFSDNFFIGISTEYYKSTDDGLKEYLTAETNTVAGRVSETVEMIPLEITSFFNIPQALENLNIYLGGGIGFYFGNRVKKFAGYETVTISRQPMAGIKVLTGVEYMLTPKFALNLQFEFREAGFIVKSRFPNNNITIDGITYYFPQELNSKIYVDGLKISLGAGIYF